MITKPTTYTAQFVKKELQSILKEIRDNPKIIYIGEVFESRSYPRQVYSVWANDFSKNKKISDTIKQIDSILESRVNVGGLRQKLSPAMVIFNLKNNYGWKDEKHLDHTTKGEKITTDVSKLTPEQRDARLQELTTRE